MASSNINYEVGVILTEDLVFEILLWLPVVSLLRFKSVCKSWFSLIQSPRFVSQHINNRNGTEEENNNHHQLIILQHTLSGPYSMLLLLLSSLSSFRNGNNNNNNNNRYQVLDLPEYFQNNPIEIRFGKMFSCNGIICCLHHYQKDVSLWNPATKQFRILPISQLSPPPRASRVDLGFGFDLNTNDFKVIKLFFFCPKPNFLYNQVEVYSLTTNSWKSFGHLDLPIDCVVSDPNTPLQNGEIYCWMGRDSYAGNGMIRILSYNFCKEVFETVPLPKHDWDSFRCPTLAILRGKIAVIVSIRHPEFSEDNYVSLYQICVMNEYGVKDSWTTLYTVGPLSFFTQPVGFPRNEDLFLFRKGGHNEEQLCLCDFATQQINNLPEQDSSVNLQVVVYKESLFSVG